MFHAVIPCLSIVLFAIVFSNGLFFIMAILEYFSAKRNKNPWVQSHQILNPIIPNGKPSVVLVHGFVGSPFDFKELAEELQSKGFRVIVPCVPGQGASSFAYLRSKYKINHYIDWIINILNVEHDISGVTPFLVGFSMGGTLSSIIASQQGVRRLVLIAPFFDFPKKNSASFVSAFGLLLPVVPKTGKGKINDPLSYKRYIPGSMMISIPAFRVLRRLSRFAERGIDRITCPTRVFCSRNDRVASFDRINELFGRLENVEIKEYNKGNHILLHDYQKHEIIRDICLFLRT